MAANETCPEGLLQTISGLSNQLLACKAEVKEIQHRIATKEALAAGLLKNVAHVGLPGGDHADLAEFSNLVPFIGPAAKLSVKKEVCAAPSLDRAVRIGNFWQKVVCSKWVIGVEVENTSSSSVFNVSVHVSSLVQEDGPVRKPVLSDSQACVELKPSASAILVTSLDVPSFASSDFVRAALSLVYCRSSSTDMVVHSFGSMVLKCVDIATDLFVNLTRDLTEKTTSTESIAFHHVMKVERVEVNMTESQLLQILIENVGIVPACIQSSTLSEYTSRSRQNESLRDLVLSMRKSSLLDSHTLLCVYFPSDNILVYFLTLLTSQLPLGVFVSALSDENSAGIGAFARAVESESQVKSSLLEKTVRQWKDLSTTVSARGFIAVSDQLVQIEKETDTKRRT